MGVGFVRSEAEDDDDAAHDDGDDDDDKDDLLHSLQEGRRCVHMPLSVEGGLSRLFQHS